ncbi:GNAT family N-acetyltransferase [Leifsonia sp. F6_8S_P_1B]|uniref:GNAT family N-acetyltransferase n=1 Tax=Leifsonia williamsii TaxID=3035919 RepID=A0ABT8KFY5_9MICO|nr:GNAT family N-acetyltransferase [Leifsonia williamsii]MDN4615913.1 GNAT family N-acetyltransferase [Leifsonia williamsii]
MQPIPQPPTPLADRATVVVTRPDDPLAAPLVEELSREYDERYGLNDGIPSSAELSRYPAERFTEEEGGTFLLLVDDGRPVAGGAFMREDDTTVEIKRVWTHSGFRRQGLARRVMAELEREAARRGIRTVVLTTGARQPEAVALYLALGYSPLFDLDGDWEQVSYLGFRKEL